MVAGFIGGWELLLILVVNTAVYGGVIFFFYKLWQRVGNANPHRPPAAPLTPHATPAPTVCPRCGGPVGPGSPQGICPRCAMSVGMATGTQNTGGVGSSGAQSAGPPPTLAELAKCFPQLEILACVGRGGMGLVYQARQPKLDRMVALKILAPEKSADPRFADRFLREAQALARLSHPNIVTVHDFGEVGGLYYLLMEYVDGSTLRELMRRGPVPAATALAIIPKICEALQFAHSQGVVHRDIKPENVFMDRQGQVKIGDFGIAKILDNGSSGAALTQNQAIGTPHYMAPEQVEVPGKVDHRADIYSLGVVFYEMLTGELPLGKFPLPSSRAPMDARLDEVVLRSLEKAPEHRYQNASDVKTDVETIATTPPAAPGTTPASNP